ncbi:hypothetical protein V8F33_004909 [Rhypophila sp. PSN 637]
MRTLIGCILGILHLAENATKNWWEETAISTKIMLSFCAFFPHTSVLQRSSRLLLGCLLLAGDPFCDRGGAGAGREDLASAGSCTTAQGKSRGKMWPAGGAINCLHTVSLSHRADPSLSRDPILEMPMLCVSKPRSACRPCTSQTRRVSVSRSRMFGSACYRYHISSFLSNCYRLSCMEGPYHRHHLEQLAEDSIEQVENRHIEVRESTRPSSNLSDAPNRLLDCGESIACHARISGCQIRL